ncbi:hypothetical protein [Enterococcus sp. AZ196]|uniref:hypothetical protein n=1 Tax=Enterococcus sp. AZ196 TaxID=2774659 RepID=UPI003D2E5D3D
MDFSELLKLSEEKYAAYLLSQDLLYKKIPENQHSKLLNQSIACGKAAARDLTVADLREYCQQQAIEIDYFSENLKAENFRFVLAEFQLPNRIRINQSLLEAAEPFLAELDFLKDQRVDEILLAHELYHYIENQQQLFTTQKQLSYRAGPFKKSARVHSLSEIAAMSFAKELLGLNFSPILLNIVLLFPVAPDYSQELAKRLLLID